MAPPAGFRRVNEMVGAFVLVSVAVIVTMVVLAGRAQRWFEPMATITIDLPEEGSFGLRSGADVEILGTVVGSVGDISLSDTGRMQAQIDLRGDFRRFVRVDSVAVIKKRSILAADPYVEILRGRGAELPAEAATIKAVADRATTQVLEDAIDQIRQEAVAVLRELHSSLRRYSTLASDLTDPEGRFQQLLDRLNKVASHLERGEGVAGRLLTDPAWSERVEQSLVKLSVSLDALQAASKAVQESTAMVSGIAESVKLEAEQVPAIISHTQEILRESHNVIKDVRQATQKLPGVVAAIGGEAEVLPGLVMQVQQTLREIERLVQGIQQNWMFRGSMEEDRGPTRISPLEADDAGGTR